MKFDVSPIKANTAAADTFDYRLTEPVARKPLNNQDETLASSPPYGRSKAFDRSGRLVNAFPAAQALSAQVAEPFKKGGALLLPDPGPIKDGHTSLFHHELGSRADTLFKSLPAPRSSLTVGELFERLGVKTINGVEKSDDETVRALLRPDHRGYISPAWNTAFYLKGLYEHFAARPVALDILDRRVADLPRKDLPEETIGSLLKKLGATNLYEAQMHLLDAEQLGKADTDLRAAVEANLPAVQEGVTSLIKDFDFVASAFPENAIAATFTKQLHSGLWRRDEAVRQMKFFRGFLETPKLERLAFLKKEFTRANYGWSLDRAKNAAPYPLENPIARQSLHEFVVRNLPQRHVPAFENFYNNFWDRGQSRSELRSNGQRLSP